MHSTDLQWGVPREFNMILDELLDGGQGQQMPEIGMSNISRGSSNGGFVIPQIQTVDHSQQLA